MRVKLVTHCKCTKFMEMPGDATKEIRIPFSKHPVYPEFPATPIAIMGMMMYSYRTFEFFEYGHDEDGRFMIYREK